MAKTKPAPRTKAPLPPATLPDDSTPFLTVHDADQALYYIKSIGELLSAFDPERGAEIHGVGYLLVELAGETEKCLARKGREG